jgi:hypothetical protein
MMVLRYSVLSIYSVFRTLRMEEALFDSNFFTYLDIMGAVNELHEWK